MPQPNSTSHDDLTVQFVQFIAVIHVTIALFGIFGNILSLTVLVIEKQLQTIPNIYVGNLAVADLLICLLIPVSTAQLVSDFQIPHPVCKIIGKYKHYQLTKHK